MAGNQNSGGVQKRIRDEQAIIDMYFKGYSQLEIAEHFNIDNSVVSTVIRRYKIRNSDAPITDDQVEVEMQLADKGKILALYKAHWTIKDIAIDANVTERTVVAVLKEAGYEGY